jgi:hypothetical protein
MVNASEKYEMTIRPQAMRKHRVKSRGESKLAEDDT